MRKGQEEAPEWLARVANESTNPEARKMAAFALSEWNRLLASWSARGVKTRRSLYDLLSGLLQIAKNYTWNQDMVTVTSGSDEFYFPTFAEACDYRSRARPASAIVTGVKVQSHRVPQKAKWGNDVCKT